MTIALRFLGCLNYDNNIKSHRSLGWLHVAWDVLDYGKMIKIADKPWLNIESGPRGPPCPGLDELPKAEGKWETCFLCHYSTAELFAAPLLRGG